MAEAPEKWFLSPQGWIAAIAIVSTFLTAFYVRERQLWEHGTQLAIVESRGDKAIAAANTRFERMEQVLSQTRDQVNFLERKIDRLEIWQKEHGAYQQPYQ